MRQALPKGQKDVGSAFEFAGFLQPTGQFTQRDYVVDNRNFGPTLKYGCLQIHKGSPVLLIGKEPCKAYQLTDIITHNQLIYLVNTYHLTGFDYNILEEKINETCQKL